MELALSDERDPWSGGLAAASNENAPVEQDSHQIETHLTNKENVMEREVKCAVKTIVTTKSANMVDESLEDT